MSGARSIINERVIFLHVLGFMHLVAAALVHQTVDFDHESNFDYEADFIEKYGRCLGLDEEQALDAFYDAYGRWGRDWV